MGPSVGYERGTSVGGDDKPSSGTALMEAIDMTTAGTLSLCATCRGSHCIIIRS